MPGRSSCRAPGVSSRRAAPSYLLAVADDADVSVTRMRPGDARLVYGDPRDAALGLGRSAVRVNAVAPGLVQTGWMDTALMDRVREAIPMGRVGEPEDIADAVVSLASRRARWITGQVLQVAGGHAL
ncbi:SDR family oxidoreductase [Streptomyces anulatus]|uniref:SDR family oxidoreductase n=1 Tax=Streptomyces anulatus TaxID=1892 RepID=UPI00381C3333